MTQETQLQKPEAVAATPPPRTLRADQAPFGAYILDEVGEDGLAIARYIEEHAPTSDIDIVAAHAALAPSIVRRVLYQLQDAGVATYVRDTGPRGWETFWWNLTLEDVRDRLAKRVQDELENARRQLALESREQFFCCGGRHRRMAFGQALDMDFRCPVCSSPMQAFDNSGVEASLACRIGELAAVPA